MTFPWSELALVDRIAREHATDLFTDWPWAHDAVLEVRRCACGEILTKVIEPSKPTPQLVCTHAPARDVQAPPEWHERASS